MPTEYQNEDSSESGALSKAEKNREDHNMALFFHLLHRGPHGQLYRQAVRSRILVEATELKTSRIRAMWTAVSSPLMRSPFKSTWLAKKANHVDSCRGAEI